MNGWKMITTAVVTVGVLILALGGSIINSTMPEEVNKTGIDSFLDSFKDTVSDVFSTNGAENSLRNITFFVNASNFPDMERELRESNITIDAESIKLNTTSSDMEFHKPTEIISFTGKIEIKNKQLSMEGRYDKIKLSDVELSGEGNMEKGVAEFKELKIDPMDKSRISMINATGDLKVNELNMDLENNEVEIFNPEGVFTFSDRYLVEGMANKVLVKGKETVSITS